MSNNNALSQLAAVGIQDTHLTINPQKSFFKTSYERHSSFSTLYDEFEGKAGNYVQITRNGDLIDPEITVNFTIPNFRRKLTSLEILNVIDTLTLNIGNADILTYDKYSLHTYLKIHKKDIYQSLNYDEDGVICLIIRIPFFIGIKDHLPLISLAYHDVRFKMTTSNGFLGNINEVIIEVHGEDETLDIKKHIPREIATGIYSFVYGFQENEKKIRNIKDYKLGVNYIFLDSAERRLFAQNSHEHLSFHMKTQKFTKSDVGNTTVCNIISNHPVKYFIIYIQTDTDKLTFDETIDPIVKVGISLNDSNTTFYQPDYMRSYNPKKLLNQEFPIGMYMIPYCLHPDKHEPSGSLNTSRIDTISLHVVFPPNKKKYDIIVCSEYINVCRIQSGMFAVRFSN